MKKKLFLQKDLEARKILKNNNNNKKKKKNRTKVRNPAKASESLS